MAMVAPRGLPPGAVLPSLPPRGESPSTMRRNPHGMRPGSDIII